MLAADRGGRDAAGFLDTPAQTFTGNGRYALVFDPLELSNAATSRHVDALFGDVRVRAAAQGVGVFVGIGPADAVAGYLASVERERVVDFRTDNGAVQQRWPVARPPLHRHSRRSGSPPRPDPARSSSPGPSPRAAGPPS